VHDLGIVMAAGGDEIVVVSALTPPCVSSRKSARMPTPIERSEPSPGRDWLRFLTRPSCKFCSNSVMRL
jgi:hypothetical protein